MEQNQITEEEIARVLEVVKKLGYINWAVCNKELASPAKATAMLKILQTRGFIQETENGEWRLNTEQMTFSSSEDPLSTVENVDTAYTLKARGIKGLLKEKEFSDPDFEISSILTSDLTAQEIVGGMAVIADTLPLLTEFLNKYGELSEKLKECEKKDKSIVEQANNIKNGFWLAPVIFLMVGISCYYSFSAHQMISEQQALWGAFLWCSGCVCWFFLSRASLHERANTMLLEKKSQLEPEIHALKQQITDLSATDILKNATFGVSKLSALFIVKNLLALADILNKMAVIVGDKDSTASARLLAMENLLYLVKKQEMDEKLLDESKRANDLAEEKVKAMQKVERAVNLQTEYKIWQDRGGEVGELGKILAASRLYRDD